MTQGIHNSKMASERRIKICKDLFNKKIYHTEIDNNHC